MLSNSKNINTQPGKLMHGINYFPDVPKNLDGLLHIISISKQYAKKFLNFKNNRFLKEDIYALQVIYVPVIEIQSENVPKGTITFIVKQNFFIWGNCIYNKGDIITFSKIYDAILLENRKNTKEIIVLPAEIIAYNIVNQYNNTTLNFSENDKKILSELQIDIDNDFKVINNEETPNLYITTMILNFDVSNCISNFNDCIIYLQYETKEDYYKQFLYYDANCAYYFDEFIIELLDTKTNSAFINVEVLGFKKDTTDKEYERGEFNKNYNNFRDNFYLFNYNKDKNIYKNLNEILNYITDAE